MGWNLLQSACECYLLPWKDRNLTNIYRDGEQQRDFHAAGNGLSESDYIPLLSHSRKCKHRSDHSGSNHPTAQPNVFSNRACFPHLGSKLTGWRVGILCSACTSAVVFLFNVILTIWVARTFPTHDGITTLIGSDCTKTKTWATWLHLGINILSTALLGASNYTIQFLLAPTREDVDKAHSNGKWLVIGMTSRHNLGAIGLKRLILFVLLVVTSLPLHLV